MSDIYDSTLKFVEALIPALAVMYWDYQKSVLNHQADLVRDAKTKLEMEKNHEAIDQKYAGKSDLDILNDSISVDGSGPNKE